MDSARASSREVRLGAAMSQRAAPNKRQPGSRLADDLSCARRSKIGPIDGRKAIAQRAHYLRSFRSADRARASLHSAGLVNKIAPFAGPTFNLAAARTSPSARFQSSKFRFHLLDLTLASSRPEDSSSGNKTTASRAHSASLCSGFASSQHNGAREAPARAKNTRLLHVLCIHRASQPASESALLISVSPEGNLYWPHWNLCRPFELPLQRAGNSFAPADDATSVVWRRFACHSIRRPNEQRSFDLCAPANQIGQQTSRAPSAQMDFKLQPTATGARSEPP